MTGDLIGLPVAVPQPPDGVRIAAPDEEDDIMDLMRFMHAENGIFPLDEPKVRDTIQRSFRRDMVILAVIGDKGQLQASTCLEIAQLHYTQSWHLGDKWTFVKEEYRSARLGNLGKLISYQEYCSDSIGLPLLAGVVSDIRTEAKVRLYERKLGRASGAFWVRHNRTAGA